MKLKGELYLQSSITQTISCAVFSTGFCLIDSFFDNLRMSLLHVKAFLLVVIDSKMDWFFKQKIILILLCCSNSLIIGLF